MLSNLKSLVWSQHNKDFFYNIGGLTFTLEELKHGVLRGNRKKPGAILRTIGKNDPRAEFISDEFYDQRVIFLCLDMPQVMEHIECFDDPDTMDEKLNFYMKEYLNDKVEIDTLNEKIEIPQTFETYYSDFGNDDSHILKFILNWYDNYDDDLEWVLKQSNLSLSYSK